jgi:Na+/H+-dicarboxylate symporter
MKKLALHWKIIIGLILGVLWAYIAIRFSHLGLRKFTLDWIDPFGVIFINLLKLIAVPLILFSIIKGIAELKDINRLGKLGMKTLGTYLVTTAFAITVGLALVNTFNPGKVVSEENRLANRLTYDSWAQNALDGETTDGLNYLNNEEYRAKYPEVYERFYNDTLLNKFEESEKFVQRAKSRKEEGPLQILVDIVPDNLFFALGSNTLMLQIIFFAILFGATILMVEEKYSRPIHSLVNGMNEVFLKMVHVVMNVSPFFVFALLAGKVVSMAETLPQLLEIFYGLGKYSLVVIVGLAFMVFIVYPLIAITFKKGLSYGGFMKAISPAQLLAFSTSSSAATLPVTIECVQDNLKVPDKISSFVLPIGATVNMDGTSLYISVAIVFLAQFHLIDLNAAQQLTIVLTATMASIGASAVPSSGLIMMIMVLQSVGLNPAWIAIIFPVDRILDMCRTVVNVTGDATVSTFIASTEKNLNQK